MPQPHISAVLNNCPVHLIVPELVDEIKERGTKENHHNNFDDNYALLKDKFAEFYGFDKDKLSWEEFNNLLAEYNLFDLQIILGPVLRLFMAVMIRRYPGISAFTGGLDLENFVKNLTEINETSRYASLSPDEIFIYLSQPLGFKLVYQKDGDEFALGFDLSVDHPISSQEIVIYHEGGGKGASEGGHWEREPIKEKRIYYEKDNSAKLNAHIALLGNDPRVTPTGLNLLKKQVQLTQSSLMGVDRREDFADLALTLAQIEKFIYNLNYVPKTLAQKLLGDRLTNEAAEFINAFSDSDLPYDENFVKLVEHMDEMLQFKTLTKSVDAAPHYTSLQYDIVLTLLSPAVVPENIAALALGESVARSSKTVRKLTVREILALNEVRSILYEDGLSAALYRLCNQPEIAAYLTLPFIEILLGDDNFWARSSDALIERTKDFFTEKIAMMESSMPETNKFVSAARPILAGNISQGSALSPTSLADNISQGSTFSSPTLAGNISQGSTLPNESNEEKGQLTAIIETLKKSLSYRTTIGIKRDAKSRTLDNLIACLGQKEADIKTIYKDLLLVVTTHRTRLGFFSRYLSRENNASTHSAIAFSNELAKKENSALRQLLGINVITPEQIRAEFNHAVANQDGVRSLDYPKYCQNLTIP